jgi:hypothetical protein
MIGTIHIDSQRRDIYKDKKGFFYVKEEYVNIGTSLKSHIEEMQNILNDYPDAQFDWSGGYGDATVVVRYNVYVNDDDVRIVNLLDKMKLKQKERDQKILKEIKKRSPDLF